MEILRYCFFKGWHIIIDFKMIIHPFWSNKNKFDLDLKMSKCGDLRWLQIDKALFFEDLVYYSAWPQTPIWLLLSPALICMQQIVHLFWQMASSYIVRLIITAQSLIAEINQWMKSLNEALARCTSISQKWFWKCMM